MTFSHFLCNPDFGVLREHCLLTLHCFAALCLLHCCECHGILQNLIPCCPCLPPSHCKL